MNLSFVIPCYNSSKTINSVINEIQSIMLLRSNLSYEIILVDDYSTDLTNFELNRLANHFKNIVVISLSKNFGQHAALMAGYRYAKGDIVVSLDDDGQIAIEHLFDLIDKLNEGYDVVYGRYNEKMHSSFRNFGSRLNNYVMYLLLSKPKELYMSSFFVAKHYVIEEILEYKNSYPYLAGLVLRTTNSITNVDVPHRSRSNGKSNYNLSKLIKLWLNGFTSFSVKPLRISTVFGVVCALFGFMFLSYAVINYLTNPTVLLGWTSLIGIVTIIGGAILIVLGVIGEYVGRIYISINNNPQYVIKDVKKNEN